MPKIKDFSPMKKITFFIYMTNVRLDVINGMKLQVMC